MDTIFGLMLAVLTFAVVLTATATRPTPRHHRGQSVATIQARLLAESSSARGVLTIGHRR